MTEIDIQPNLLESNLYSENRPLIALVGDTLLIESVEAKLVDMGELDVVRIQTEPGNVEKYLKSLGPDLIIFDWDAPEAQFALPFLRHQIGIPLIGLDIASGQAVVLTNRRHTMASANELGQIIELQLGYKSGQDFPGLVLLDKEMLRQYLGPRLPAI
jgi:hypothetical protein